ncbi:MAG: mechanosensitive ion channel family protein [Stanieria sp.]
MLKKRYFWASLLLSFCLSWVISLPVQAQLPGIRDLILDSDFLNQRTENPIEVACIRLDGRCLFQIAFPQSNLSERISEIQTRLNQIKTQYLKKNKPQLEITQERRANSQYVYVNLGNNPILLLTVTSEDAALDGITIETKAEQIARQVENGLETAQQERQPSFLIRQGIIAAILALVIVITSLIIARWQEKSKKIKQELKPSSLSKSSPLSIRLSQQLHWNLKELQHRFFQIVQVGLWGGGTLIILGLFPQTRVLQLIIITGIRIPLRVSIIALITYVLIRLSYVIINRFTSGFVSSNLLSPRANRRMQLRVTTVSRVSKSIVTIIWLTVGFITALSVIGINVAPLLAGAGILGLAISLASQNLIKDAINGFFIILEDQYAVGDVIDVGGIGGLVENINLRITQVRDGEGRLITIPNSEIKIVANLSSQWSRADLNIPVAYHTDIDKALHLIHQVAEEICQDDNWREQIIESPQILGVENFADRGILIRVWIKTEPLKQWEVGREFRRRIKVAFDRAEIPIPPPQQQVWLNRTH